MRGFTGRANLAAAVWPGSSLLKPQSKYAQSLPFGFLRCLSIVLAAWFSSSTWLHYFSVFGNSVVGGLRAAGCHLAPALAFRNLLVKSRTRFILDDLKCDDDCLLFPISGQLTRISGRGSNALYRLIHDSKKVGGRMEHELEDAIIACSNPKEATFQVWYLVTKL